MPNIGRSNIRKIRSKDKPKKIKVPSNTPRVKTRNHPKSEILGASGSCSEIHKGDVISVTFLGK